MTGAALSCTPLVDELYPQAQRQSRTLRDSIREGIEFADKLALDWLEPELESSAARRILFFRYSLKVFAGDVRKDSIQRAISGAANARQKLNGYFQRVADMLEPRPSHNVPGLQAGAFFDPEMWILRDLAVEAEQDCDLRLAALMSAMLCQEEGVVDSGVKVVEVANAIASLREVGSPHTSGEEFAATVLPMRNAKKWSLTRPFASRRAKRI